MKWHFELEHVWGLVEINICLSPKFHLYGKTIYLI